MRHIRQAGLINDDMNLLVDIINKKMLKQLISQPIYKQYYGENTDRAQLISFLQYDLNKLPKGTAKRFYKEINDKILYIKLKLEEANSNYDEILKSKRLRELRELFATVELDGNEIKAIPILLKCMDIDYNNNIAFMIENELYTRKRINKEIEINEKNEKPILKKDDNIIIDQLMKDIEILEETIKQKDETIKVLDGIAQELELTSKTEDSSIGYFKELTEEDFGKILKDLGKHSSQIREKFKSMMTKFDEWGAHTEDKLYEMWMEWTDEEVSIIDRVLKKSLDGEIICRSDVNDLEDMSENIINRYLLSRIVLHLIYRRISSQCLEEVLI